MKHYVVYDPQTGAIARNGQCPEDHIERQASEGLIAIEADAFYSDADFYWDGDNITPRPEFDVESVGNVLVGVPEGTTLIIEGEQYEADGDDIEFEPSISGTYSVEISLFPFKPMTIEVTA